jgi:aspartyl-tRNA(Asn)/glutamyl-tRNA(Gln) amidotransferase subunit A
LIPATEYLNAQRARRVLATEFERVWASFDCLITPATPMAAPLIGQTEVLLGGVEEDVRLAGTRLARPLNVLGWPALALPCGVTQAGLPLGLQLIGAPGRDEYLLGVGAALEGVLGTTRP